jgi:hypothetical protein
MNIVGRKILGSALAAVAATGLLLATSTSAAADVAPHRHCLLTPDGWVLIAEGVSNYAPNDPALENFHYEVHLGVPGAGDGDGPVADGGPLTIVRINADQDCTYLPVP